MKFKPGDRVAALDDDLEGRVLGVQGDQVTIETLDGFPVEFSSKELVRIETPLEELPIAVDPEILKEKTPTPRKSTPRPRTRDKNTPPMEVDLHIEKLVRSWRGMSNFDILNLQLETAKRQLDFAMSRRIPKLVFIHGVGEGVLKAELDFLLGRYDNLKFYDADYQKYGSGATEVYFFQNS